jgi:pimeloyl-ACP methyl ester carboxylesterase
MPRARANGLDIAYESFGREGDPVILLIMGFAAYLTFWPETLCVGLAARGFRVIRFDNRDVGKSTHLFEKGVPGLSEIMTKALAGEPVAAPYALDDMAADAVALMEAIGARRAHIVGASMGGMIAQLVAAHYPEKTTSLVSIMSTTGRRDLPPAEPEAMAALMTPPASTEREDRVQGAMRIWRAFGGRGFRPTDAALRAIAEREVDYLPYEPTGMIRQMAAIAAAPPRNDILKKVRAPTLVIHGAEDPLVPLACGEDTARSIAGAELVVVPGLGHDMNDNIAPVYERLIGEFVARIEAGARGA